MNQSMRWEERYRRFVGLTFVDFKRMAKDPLLTLHEKTGFPESYRKGKERIIFQDILVKVPALMVKGKVVVDVGCGCGPLPRLLMELCRKRGHTLILVDSAEVLSQLPDRPFVRKVDGYFPLDTRRALAKYANRADVVLTYSTWHYVCAEASPSVFLKEAIGLLAHRGALLIGDIPNASKRKRFFASPQGKVFHRTFMGSQRVRKIAQGRRGAIDDQALWSWVSQARRLGCDAYLLPQGESLPMANRREDILICKP